MGLALVFYHEYSFIEASFLSVGGGMLGVFVFLFGYEFIKKKWKKWRGIEDESFKINRKRRFLVKLRRRFGLTGIAALTPIVLTVPVGTILATTIESSRKKIIIYMLVSFLLWGVGLSALYHFTDINFEDWK